VFPEITKKGNATLYIQEQKIKRADDEHTKAISSQFFTDTLKKKDTL